MIINQLPVFVDSSILEVVEFVERGGLLAGPLRHSECRSWTSIYQIDNLDETHIRQFQKSDEPNAEVQGKWWYDIREEDDDKFLNFHETPAERDRRIEIRRWWNSCRGSGDRFYELFIEQVGSFVPHGFISDIAGWLDDFACKRATYGVTNYMPEKLFEVYKAGGYPCGWRGRYPEGELVVYSRF